MIYATRITIIINYYFDFWIKDAGLSSTIGEDEDDESGDVVDGCGGDRTKRTHLDFIWRVILHTFTTP